MKKTVICTVCPNGCRVQVEYTCREDAVVSGNSCPRGAEYAVAECFAPQRTFSSSVPICDASRAMMPVRTDKPVPREKLVECMAALRQIALTAPVKCHTVLAADFLGTGADLITCMTLEKEGK